MTYKEVVRKAQKVLQIPGHYGKNELDLYACDTWIHSDQINFWSYWQGYQLKDIDKGIDILLVGQDWGNPERIKSTVERIERIKAGSGEFYCEEKRISPTDRNLIELFDILGCNIRGMDPGKRILFTNYCLGYRKGSETGVMSPELMNMDKELFDDLVKAVHPKVIICLGKITYEAVIGQKTENFSKTLEKGIPFISTYPGIKGTKVYGVAHCGSLGSRNVGGMSNMQKAWRKIAADNYSDRVIHEVNLDDDVLNQLIAFSEDWAAENSCYGYRANDRSDIEGNRIFFAEEDGCVVGYLFGNLYTTESRQADMPKGAPYFEVEELYVVPDKRSRGIGESLFRYAENAVKNEAEYMVLSTATKNWKAIFHFYIDELNMQFWNARLFKKIEA